MLGVVVLCSNFLTGFDRNQYNELVSEQVAQCLNKLHNHTWAVFQLQNETELSPYAAQNYQTVKSAGFQKIDFYLHPRIDKDPRTQVDEAIEWLAKDGIVDNYTLFLDVQGSYNMYDSCVDNQWFISEVMDEITAKLGKERAGILSTKDQWNEITCQWNGMSDYKLWWTYIDASTTTYHWKDFGGWTESTVAAKQYTISSRYYCNDYINEDVYYATD